MMLIFVDMATRKEVSKAAAMMGRKGGKKKVPKGLAMMDPEAARLIRSAGGKARWAKKEGKKEK
jgi:hypothetical protein